MSPGLSLLGFALLLAAAAVLIWLATDEPGPSFEEHADQACALTDDATWGCAEDFADEVERALHAGELTR